MGIQVAQAERRFLSGNACYTKVYSSFAKAKIEYLVTVVISRSQTIAESEIRN